MIKVTTMFRGAFAPGEAPGIEPDHHGNEKWAKTMGIALKSKIKFELGGAECVDLYHASNLDGAEVTVHGKPMYFKWMAVVDIMMDYWEYLYFEEWTDFLYWMKQYFPILERVNMRQGGEPKFIQISQGEEGLCALDETGLVWRYGFENNWTPLKQDRVMEK